MEETEKDRGSWLDWATNSRIDIAMAAVLLAFFYYKGGAKLVFYLVFIFLSFAALFHLASWLFRRYNRYRNGAKQRRLISTFERDPGDPH